MLIRYRNWQAVYVILIAIVIVIILIVPHFLYHDIDGDFEGDKFFQFEGNDKLTIKPGAESVGVRAVEDEIFCVVEAEKSLFAWEDDNACASSKTLQKPDNWPGEEYWVWVSDITTEKNLIITSPPNVDTQTLSASLKTTSDTPYHVHLDESATGFYLGVLVISFAVAFAVGYFVALDDDFYEWANFTHQFSIRRPPFSFSLRREKRKRSLDELISRDHN